MCVQPNYLNASAINNSTYDQLLFIASNELDWPQQSGSSGFLAEANKDCPGKSRIGQGAPLVSEAAAASSLDTTPMQSRPVGLSNR